MQLDWVENTDFKDQKTLFAEVIIPLHLPKLYTYRIPHEWNDLISVGMRVVIQFGQKKIYTAVVSSLSELKPSYEAKYILDILDDVPTINSKQLAFMNWISEYYLCHLGEVLIVSLPAGLKLSSESTVQLLNDFPEESVLSIEEQLVVNFLKKKELTLFSEIEKNVKVKSLNKIIKRLLEHNIILIFEQVKDKYSPKIVRKIRLQTDFLDKIPQLLQELEKQEKQQQILQAYISETGVLQSPEYNFLGLERKKIIEKNLSESSLNTLVKKKYFEEFEQQVSRFQIDRFTQEKKDLNKFQSQTLSEIHQCFTEKNICLLHGITGSGKTEIYIHLIEEVLNQGKQVLYLLPEIALSTQIYSRLRKIFGSLMGVYHSKFSDNERVEVYKSLNNNEIQLILGVRSSIFLPFNDLGLVIIDEEHDASYKQYEPAPRYHGRDSALYLANLHGAKVLMGSATPSIESYFLAKEGKYGLVTLKERHGSSNLPEIILHTQDSKQKNQEIWSKFIIQNIQNTLTDNNQLIAFQNRRGFAPYVQCRNCDHIPTCINCSVSLTHHKLTQDLRCHYCGYSTPVPDSCTECGSHQIMPRGMGTEKLEDDLTMLFPNAKIARLDTDTAKSKSKLENLFDDFKIRKTNILVGTQMVTKGLDFEHVTLVLVFDIDRMLFFPDFRSAEKAIQLLIQISGRAGRNKKRGKVIIQTKAPKHPLLSLVSQVDYEGFYETEIQQREEFLYPPFCRILKINVKNTDTYLAEKCAQYIGGILKNKFSSKAVLGPQEPLINRVRGYFIQEIMFKLPKNSQYIHEVKMYILEIVEHVYTKNEFKSCKIFVDVDPV